LLVSEFEDTIFGGVAPRKQMSENKDGDEGGNGFMYFMVLVILSVGGFVYLKIFRK
jgi:hypothetical protein